MPLIFDQWISHVETIQVIPSSNCPPAEELDQPLIYHIQTHPYIAWSDIYKFILQGTCGWAHLQSQMQANSSPDQPRDPILQRLEREMATLDPPAEKENVFDLLDAETRLGRINLRPVKYGKSADAKKIYDCMKRSQSELPPSLAHFRTRWRELQQWIQKGYFSFLLGDENTIQDWIAYVGSFSAGTDSINDMPLISHSAMYRIHYSPAYRIIAQKYLEVL